MLISPCFHCKFLELGSIPETRVLFACPSYKGEDLETITKVLYKHRILAVVTNFLAPIIDSMHIGIGKARWGSFNRGRAVEMRVDFYKLIVIVLIRMQIAWTIESTTVR